MGTTNYVLIAWIIVYLLYTIYDSYLIYSFKGTTKVAVKLRRRSWFDGVIFVALIIFVIYQGIVDYGMSTTSFYLIGILIVIGIYHTFVRRPVFLLKDKGFFFSGFFMTHDQIGSIMMTEEGQLVIELKHNQSKKILVEPIDIEDITKIMEFYIESKRVSPQYAANFAKIKNQQN